MSEVPIDLCARQLQIAHLGASKVGFEISKVLNHLGSKGNFCLGNCFCNINLPAR